jgi:hypothetical protein
MINNMGGLGALYGVVGNMGNTQPAPTTQPATTPQPAPGSGSIQLGGGGLFPTNNRPVPTGNEQQRRGGGLLFPTGGMPPQRLPAVPRPTMPMVGEGDPGTAQQLRDAVYRNAPPSVRRPSPSFDPFGYGGLGARFNNNRPSFNPGIPPSGVYTGQQYGPQNPTVPDNSNLTIAERPSHNPEDLKQIPTTPSPPPTAAQMYNIFGGGFNPYGGMGMGGFGGMGFNPYGGMGMGGGFNPYGGMGMGFNPYIPMGGLGGFSPYNQRTPTFMG